MLNSLFQLLLKSFNMMSWIALLKCLAHQHWTAPEKSNISFASIKGYCLTTYNNHWYLAWVLKVKPESYEVRLSFLHPHGPAHFTSISINSWWTCCCCQWCITDSKPINSNWQNLYFDTKWNGKGTTILQQRQTCMSWSSFLFMHNIRILCKKKHVSQ